jgi:hypothetical protein
MISVGFRTNEALYWLSYGASYLSPEGGRPGSHTQAVSSIIMSGIAPKQNAFKFKIAPHKQKSIVKNKFGRKMPPPLANDALCLKYT